MDSESSEKEDLQHQITILLSVLNDENVLTKGTLNESISSRVVDASPNTLAAGIQYDMNVMSTETLLLYHQLIELIHGVVLPMTEHLKKQWMLQATSRVHESIFQENMNAADYISPRMGGEGAIGTLAAKQLRKDVNIVVTQIELAAEDEQLFGKRSDRPLLFAASYGGGSGSGSGGKGGSDNGAVSSNDIGLVEEEEGEGGGGEGGEGEKQEEKATQGGTAKEEASKKTPPSSQPPRGIHLIVFQHGYQGTTYDLRLFRDTMTFVLPTDGHNGGTYHYLIASSNERQTDGNIEMMGNRLAKEVSTKINSLESAKKKQNEEDLSNSVTRLSFVSHSLGSVIVRSALTSHLLTPYIHRLYNFFSLTSTHIGFFFAPGIVNTAVWFLKRWHKSLALEQLSLSDDQDIRKTFFYRLSQASAPLSHFEHVVLVGSHQDNYAPYHSARIEMTKEAIQLTKNKNSTGTASNDLKAMITNILKHIEPSKLTRIDVDFKLDGLTVDNSIGRAAHIRFLDSFQLTLGLVLGYKHLWEW